jgi:peptidoglycan/xylan/chitin deacetylase (PgdA/CDA1 family)
MRLITKKIENNTIMKNGKQRVFLIAALSIGLFNGMCYGQYYEAKAGQQKNKFEWPEGKSMALSLTYDDARLSEIDEGIPLLNKYGVKATFYISPENLKQRLEGWQEAVKNGHDIGNHTQTHPCTGNFSWSRDKALEDYTLEKMKEELDSSNALIKNKLGVKAVSFAYPCGQKFVGRGVGTKSYVPLVASTFETGRGWMDETPNDPIYCDMAQLTGMEMDGKSFDELKELIESAKEQGMWLILVGHEMGKGGNQTSLLSTIEAMCNYAMDPSNGIWIDNVHNIASYINEKRGENSFSK